MRRLLGIGVLVVCGAGACGSGGEAATTTTLAGPPPTQALTACMVEGEVLLKKTVDGRAFDLSVDWNADGALGPAAREARLEFGINSPYANWLDLVSIQALERRTLEGEGAYLAYLESAVTVYCQTPPGPTLGPEGYVHPLPIDQLLPGATTTTTATTVKV